MSSLQEICAFLALSLTVVTASTGPGSSDKGIAFPEGWTGGSFVFKSSDVKRYRLSNFSRTISHSSPEFAELVNWCIADCEGDENCAGIQYSDNICDGFKRIPLSLYFSQTGFAAFLNKRSTLGWEECTNTRHSLTDSANITDIGKLRDYHPKDISRDVNTNIHVTGLADGDELIMANDAEKCPFRFPAGEQQTVKNSTVSFKAPKEGTFKFCLKEAGKSCIKLTSVSIGVHATSAEMVNTITPDTVAVGTSNKIKLEGGRSQDEACISMKHCRYACKKDSQKLVLNRDLEIRVPDLRDAGTYHLCYRMRNTKTFVRQENVTLTVTSDKDGSGAEPNDSDGSGVDSNNRDGSGAEPNNSDGSGAEPNNSDGSGAEPSGGSGNKTGDKKTGDKKTGDKKTGDQGARFPIKDFMLGWLSGCCVAMVVWIVLVQIRRSTPEGRVDSTEQPETSEEVSPEQPETSEEVSPAADRNPTETTDEAAA